MQQARTPFVQPGRSPIGIWILCLFAALIEGYDLQSAGVGAPSLVAEQGFTRPQLGWIFSSNTTGLFLGAVIGGVLADRIGRKALLAASLLAFGLFSIGSALTTGFADLILLRFLTGIGLGGAFPNIIALVADGGRERNRSGRVTLVTAAMPLGGACAALLLHFATLDWRSIFIVGGVAPILLAAAVWLLLPDRASAAAPGQPSAARDIVHTLFGEGRVPRTLALWTASFCTLLLLHLLLNWLPTLLAGQAVGASTMLWATVGFSVSGAFGAITLGLLLGGRARSIALLLTFLGLGASLFALGTGSHHDAIASASACGFFLVAAQFALYGLSAECYPAPMRGTGAGAAIAAGRLGAIAGPLVGGASVALGSLIGMLLPLVLMAAGATLVLLLTLRPRARSGTAFALGADVPRRDEMARRIR